MGVYWDRYTNRRRWCVGVHGDQPRTSGLQRRTVARMLSEMRAQGWSYHQPIPGGQRIAPGRHRRHCAVVGAASAGVSEELPDIAPSCVVDIWGDDEMSYSAGVSTTAASTTVASVALGTSPASDAAAAPAPAMLCSMWGRIPRHSCVHAGRHRRSHKSVLSQASTPCPMGRRTCWRRCAWEQ